MFELNEGGSLSTSDTNLSLGMNGSKSKTLNYNTEIAKGSTK